MQAKLLRTDVVASRLPHGLRDGVTVQAQAQADLEDWMAFSPQGRRAAAAMRGAKAGIPQDAEQDARWRRLGIHPDRRK